MIPTVSEGAFLSADQKSQFIRDGFVVARGLLPEELVKRVHDDLLRGAEIDPADPETWKHKHVLTDGGSLKLTEQCRTEAVESVAQELVGPHFVRGEAFSPNLASRGVEPPIVRGYIPVLRIPEPGQPRFAPILEDVHIDGLHFVTTWPTKHFLVVFAYLSDVTEFGGATTVWPGSHRQIFEHWVQTKFDGSPKVPELDYAAPIPLTGQAGDVVFMHYLLAHSSSRNFSHTIRVGLNTAVLPDSGHPYTRKPGVPDETWTPLDWSLRTDNLAGLNP